MKKRQAARRNSAADAQLTGFIATNQGRLVAIAYRLTRNTEDARDLVQDALLKACEKAHQFDGKNLGGWLYTIIRNSWIERGRVRVREQRAQPRLMGRESLREVTDDRAELCIVLQDVLRLLGALPRYQRRAITAISTGSKYREVARRQRITEGSVKSAVSRARVTLMQAL